jgi:sporulation protein YlmC with PRC-barrel domain
MPFFAGEIFVSEIINKPVLDQKGEEIGRLKDIVISPGEPFPAVSALVVAAGRTASIIPWDIVNLFNRRVISINIISAQLAPASVLSAYPMSRDMPVKRSWT